MAGFFNLPSSRATTKKDQQLLKKVTQPIQDNNIKLKGSGKLIDRIQAACSFVKSKFEGKEDSLLLIREEQSLIDYIDKAIENNRISIDTETTGLNTILDDIVGICIHTEGLKPAYIPINHVSYITNVKCNDQLPVDFIREQFQRLVDADVKTYWFNAPFDIKILGNHVGVWFTPYWDCYIAAMCLNSDEKKGEKSLKDLRNKYCNDGKGEVLTFGKLFEGIPFNLIPIDVAYLYAAHDAIYTDELADFQAQYLEPNGIYYESHNMQGVSNVFFNIEMKSMPTFIAMENLGTAIDYEHAKKIQEKYHKLTDTMQQNLDNVLEDYMGQIDEYRRSHPGCKLSDPINLGSTQQLAIVLYDILGLKSPDKEKPRGTDKEILEQLDHPLCNAISDVRKFKKVVSTYIDKMPEEASKYPDKRIHCKFNQYGAETGRVSSDSPNLQNIPSRSFKLKDGTEIDSGHDVRQLFTASPGYIMLSCDYSGQEVRVTAHLSQDEKMIQAYKDGKDVYSEIASIIFNVPYEECCEKRPDGTYSKEGKERRATAKPVVLGILYGRGIASIGEQLHKNRKEAQAIYDKVLAKFPGLAMFLEESEDMAREYGYVTTVWGRRRQLPAMQLPYYEFTYKNGMTPDFDPLSDEETNYSTEVPEEEVRRLTNRLLRCNYKERELIKEKIRQSGINIKDNTGHIAKAKREVVNSRVQGSSADLTKLAQIELFNHKELKELGFRMLIPVHDEIIAECPVENAKRCAELMSQCMINAGRDLCVPLTCDVELFYSWYGESIDVNTL